MEALVEFWSELKLLGFILHLLYEDLKVIHTKAWLYWGINYKLLWTTWLQSIFIKVPCFFCATVWCCATMLISICWEWIPKLKIFSNTEEILCFICFVFTGFVCHGTKSCYFITITWSPGRHLSAVHCITRNVSTKEFTQTRTWTFAISEAVHWFVTISRESKLFCCLQVSLTTRGQAQQAGEP